MKTLLNKIFSNKNLVLMAFLFLMIAGTIQNIFFILAPALYAASLSGAYIISGRIIDPMVNVMFNWAVKWSLFVVFLYLTALYIKEAFVYVMFSLILINTTLNPMTFIAIAKNKVLS